MIIPCRARQGIIIHEIVHSLGFAHEQSRPDRDQFVKIDWDNVDPELVQNFEKLVAQEYIDLGTPYDYKSVNISCFSSLFNVENR